MSANSPGLPGTRKQAGSPQGAGRRGGPAGGVLSSHLLKCKSICQSADSPFTILPCGDRVFKNGFHAHLKIPGTRTGWVPSREEAGRVTLLLSPVPSQLRDAAPSKLGALAWSLGSHPPAGAPCPQHTPLPHRCPQSPAHPRVYLPLHPKWLLLLTPRTYPRSPLPRPTPGPFQRFPPPVHPHTQRCSPATDSGAPSASGGGLLAALSLDTAVCTHSSMHTLACSHGGAPASSELTHTRAAPFLVPRKGNAQKASPALWRLC